jgi:ribosome maturation factor RimP
VYNRVEVGKGQWAEAHFFVASPKQDMTGGVLEKVRVIAERVAASEGLEVVEVEMKGGGRSRVVRIIIDKPAGVTHADCETVSQQVGTILDVEDVIPGGSYHLEVSSPGIERKLTRPKDFERFTGQKIRVTLKEPVERRTHWEGTLGGFQSGVITLDAGEAGVVRFGIEQVKKANLKFEW